MRKETREKLRENRVGLGRNGVVKQPDRFKIALASTTETLAKT